MGHLLLLYIYIHHTFWFWPFPASAIPSKASLPRMIHCSISFQRPEWNRPSSVCSLRNHFSHTNLDISTIYLPYIYHKSTIYLPYIYHISTIVAIVDQEFIRKWFAMLIINEGGQLERIQSGVTTYPRVSFSIGWYREDARPWQCKVYSSCYLIFRCIEQTVTKSAWLVGGFKTFYIFSIYWE